MFNSKLIDRRRFLNTGAALVAGASLPLGLSACLQNPAASGTVAKRLIKTNTGYMRARVIPDTNEYLPVVGLGAPAPFIKLGDTSRELPKSLIRTMLENGGRVIDAPSFFRSGDPILGDILTELGLQDELFLTGKITVDGKQQGIAHIERISRYLNKKPMDLLMVHNMQDLVTHWPTLQQWKAEGKVRYIGVSRTRETDFTALEQFMRAEKPDFILIGYSITQQGPAERILPLAADIGTAVIGAEAFKASADGAFFKVVAGKPLPEWAVEFDCESWAQFSLKYILSNPAITTIVTETSKPKHVIDNMHAGYGRLPDQAMRKKMSEYLLGLGA